MLRIDCKLILFLSYTLVSLFIPSTRAADIFQGEVLSNPYGVYKTYLASASQPHNEQERIKFALSLHFLGKKQELIQTLSSMDFLAEDDSEAGILFNFLSAIIEEREGNYGLSLIRLNRAINFTTAENDAILKILLLQEIGYIYALREDFEAAYNYLQRAFTLARDHKSEFGMALSESTLAAVYSYNGDTEKANEGYQASLKRFEQLNYHTYISEVLEGLASNYRTEGNVEAALASYAQYEQSLNVLGGLDNMIYVHYGRAMTLAQANRCDEALQEIAFAIELSPPLDYLSELYKEQANCAISAGNLTLASKALTQAQSFFADRPELVDTLWSIKLTLIEARLLTAQHRYNEAIAAYERYIMATDIASNTKYSKDLAHLRTLYEDTRKNWEIEKLQADAELQRLALEHQANRSSLIQLIAILVFFIAILLLVFALAQRKRSSELLKLSITDALTGMSNRRHALEMLYRWQQRENQNTKLCIALIDIDNFKSVNDTFGHAVGDMMIKAIADLITAGLRNVDIVARYGGEEFLVALQRTSLDDATRILQRLCDTAAHTAITSDGVNITRTISIGAVYVESSATAVNQLLEQADQALYKAKRSGKNRLEFYRKI